MTKKRAAVKGHHADQRHRSTPTKPTSLKVLPENIPQELREKTQWVVWRYTWSNKKDKWDKPALCPGTLRPASSTDPDTWATFEEARGAYQDRDNDLDEIGFVIRPEDELTGFDLDHCRTPETARYPRRDTM